MRPVLSRSESIDPRERWTILIVRELLMGATRFSQLQRGLCQISPSMLTQAVDELGRAGVLLRKRIPGQRGYEYHLGDGPGTHAGGFGHWQLGHGLGTWRDGRVRARRRLLMLYLQRSVDPDKLVGDESIVRFRFTDRKTLADWWLVVKDGEVELCNRDPGKEVDVYFTTDLRTMIELWMGDVPYRTALADGRLTLVGPRALTRNVYHWLALARFADVPSAGSITV
ncbi:MAG: winged helix-turn-helix transcriptional regulator [Sedimenticolaceae bacterium]